MPKRLTHEEFLERVYSQSREHGHDITVLGEYKNQKSKVKCRCNVCGHEWEAIAHNLYNRGTCPKCSISNRVAKRRTTHDDFVAMMASRRRDLIVLGKYETTYSKIKVKSIRCGHEWEARANNLLHSNSGCPICYGHNKTTSDFIKEVNKLNINVEVLGEYTGSKSDILCKCTLCGKEWMSTPNSLLHGTGCYECGHKRGGMKIRISNDDYVIKMSYANPDVEMIGTYTRSKDPVEFRCKKCGNIWETAPANVANSGSGCPRCKSSKGEREIARYLDQIGVEYVHQKRFGDCVDVAVLPFDFYIPSINTCIEYDGALHYKPVEYYGGQDYYDKIQKHDTIKTKYCNENGIALVRIPYWDLDVIDNVLNNLFENERNVM